MVLATFVGGAAIVIGSLWAMGQAHSSERLTVENRTDREVTLLVDRRAEITVPPGATTTAWLGYGVDWDDNPLVQIIDSNGVHLFDEHLDELDVERMDGRLIIDD
jgi:hypothetical protein